MDCSAEYHSAFIHPGKPQLNAYIERYNRAARYDWLGLHLYTSLDELQGYATQWQQFYNHERPNMVPNGFTPMQHIQRMFWFHLSPPLKMGGLSGLN